MHVSGTVGTQVVSFVKRDAKYTQGSPSGKGGQSVFMVAQNSLKTRTILVKHFDQ